VILMDEVARIAVMVWAVLFLVGQQVIGIFTAGNAKPIKDHTSLMGELMCKVVAAALLGEYVARPNLVPVGIAVPAPVRLFGLVPVAAGLVLSLSAFKELGKYWVNGVGLYRQHRLITTGPYTRVRHPMYSGFGLSMLGLVVLAANLPVLLGCLFLGFAFIHRIPYEEMLLHQRFAERHDNYRRRAGVIFPRLRPRRPRLAAMSTPAAPQVKRPLTNTARREQARRQRAKRR
jgi:protein-S-isoprenylcysteine O-methyltransferase Ste14